ncbi:MAG: hypothetical protein WAN11_14365 [Syntrophobacteraceae bacterium]
MKSRVALSTVVVLSVMLLCGRVHAVDGVVLIDQARANAGGVTPGDTRGFPVTISRSGSYRLSSNLTVTKANTTCIEITSDDVTLDLNGFTISGPTVCTPGANKSVSCSPTGNGIGVNAPTEANIAVTNGVVRGMGLDGINLAGTNTRAENIQAYSNGGNGILSTIGTNNTSSNNGRVGITIVNGSNNTSSNNGGDGIDSSGTANNNVSNDNGGVGINAGTANNNASFDNGGDGIDAYTANGNTAVGNTGNGITAGTANNNVSNSNGGNGIVANTAIGNTAAGNAGYGLTSSGGYTNNVFQDNATGQVSGGLQMGTNVCNGAACL